jgi:hypothetical protein
MGLLWEVPPSVINDVARLTLCVTEDFGPEIIDNAERFDQVFGAGSFARTDGRVLDVVRSIIESQPDRVWRARLRPGEKIEQKRSDGD